MTTDPRVIQLITAFQQSWPNLSAAIEGHHFPEDSNPTPLLTSIASTTNSPEKNMFCSLLQCFDSKFGDLKEQLTSCNLKLTETNSVLSQSQQQVTDLNANLANVHQQLVSLEQTYSQQLNSNLSQITSLNSELSKVNLHRSTDNDKIAALNDKISALQADKNNLCAELNSNNKPSRSTDSIDTRPRRTRSDPDKFSASQQNTEKRQLAYESWKIHIQQILLIDSICFPGAFYRISFVTSQLSGKAWEAVKDGVQLMNSLPSEPEKWPWKSTIDLWQVLDKRYILLDTSQTAKNALDTLFQEKRAYGDFKADFDHFAERAKYDNRTKVDLLRKRLNRKICNVIDNQVNLPGPDDFLGWSDMVGSIARNLQQQEHIVRLQAPHNSIRQNEPIANEPSSDIGPVDIGDPMDLSRVKLSNAERKYRMDNGLCIACGENGHSAKDHHRKINPIPMPKRPSSYPTNRNFSAPAKNHSQNPQPTPISAFYYHPMQYFNHQLPHSSPNQFLQPFPPSTPS